MSLREKGIFLAFLTAIVSGFSIFMNKFAIATIEPFTFTTAKNIVVVVLLFSLILLLREFKQLKILSSKQWFQLAAIGLIGGSIPFLIYFWALKLTTAINAGFIHKTLFVWASFMALFFLREKIDRKFVLGAALLLIGNYLMFSTFSSFGFPEMLIFVATFLWAAENVLAKHVLKELNGRAVAFGRMFFGSIFMLAFLAATNNLGPIVQLTIPQLEWILITAALLFFYVFFWYSGLKHVEVSVATAILMFGQVVTGLLSTIFSGKAPSLYEALGLLLIVFGIIVLLGISYTISLFRWKGFSLARQKN